MVTEEASKKNDINAVSSHPGFRFQGQFFGCPFSSQINFLVVLFLLSVFFAPRAFFFWLSFFFPGSFFGCPYCRVIFGCPFASQGVFVVVVLYLRMVFWPLPFLFQGNFLLLLLRPRVFFFLLLSLPDFVLPHTVLQRATCPARTDRNFQRTAP